MQCTGVQLLVFVVRGDSNEHLRLPVVHLRAERVAIRFGEIVGVAGRSSVSHVSNTHDRED